MASTPPWLERELANGGIEQRERTRMRGEEVPRKRLVCKCGFELQLHVSQAEHERHTRSKAHTTALGRPSSSGRGLSGCFSSCLPSGAPSSTSRRPSLFGASSQVAAVNAEARARAAREMQRVEVAFSEAVAKGEALATVADEQERQLQQELHTAKATATAAAETARAVTKAESKAVETMLPAMVKGGLAPCAPPTPGRSPASRHRSRQRLQCGRWA